MDACSCHESVLDGVKSPKKSSRGVRKRLIQRTRRAGLCVHSEEKRQSVLLFKRCARGLRCSRAMCVLQSLKFDRYR